LKPGGLSKPQLVHTPLARSGAAQLPQNLNPSGFPKPQAGQSTGAVYPGPDPWRSASARRSAWPVAPISW
jgi:hypothetical protein